MNDIKTYSNIIYNYFRLRPELLYSLVSLFIMFSFIYFLKWDIKSNLEDFMDLSRFEMIEIEVPIPETAEAEIATPEEALEESDEKKKKEEELKFGDDRGHYDLAALSVVPPKPKITSLPPYPDSVRKLGVEGTIVVEIGIDENGTIVYAKIVKKLHPVLNKIVLEWMKTVSFHPAIDGTGKPFKCKIFWPIRFQLADD